jgi:hypothetical protein
MGRNSVFWLIISKLIGLILFILVVWLANFFIPFINSPMYSEIVNFVNINLTFMIVMSAIFSIGEIFFALPFPVNLPAPLFSSLGTIFLVTFIGRLFQLIGFMTDIEIIEAFRVLSFIIYPLAFIGVLIGGYISIFSALVTGNGSHEKKPKSINVKRTRTWNDVGEEFKNAIFDFFSMLRRAFNRK